MATPTTATTTTSAAIADSRRIHRPRRAALRRQRPRLSIRLCSPPSSFCSTPAARRHRCSCEDTHRLFASPIRSPPYPDHRRCRERDRPHLDVPGLSFHATGGRVGDYDPRGRPLRAASGPGTRRAGPRCRRRFRGSRSEVEALAGSPTVKAHGCVTDVARQGSRGRVVVRRRSPKCRHHIHPLDLRDAAAEILDSSTAGRLLLDESYQVGAAGRREVSRCCRGPPAQTATDDRVELRQHRLDEVARWRADRIALLKDRMQAIGVPQGLGDAR